MNLYHSRCFVACIEPRGVVRASSHWWHTREVQVLDGPSLAINLCHDQSLTPLLPFQASIFSGWIPWHVVPGKEMRRLESKVVWVGWVSIESKSDSGWNMIFPERFPSVGYGYCSSYITIVPCVSMMEMVVFSPNGFLGLGLRILKKTKPKPLGQTITRWWFQRYVIFTPICGKMIQFGSNLTVVHVFFK